MTTQINPGGRVRVSLFSKGTHRRNFYGRVVAWADSGLIRVLEDGQKTARDYSGEHVRKIRSVSK